MNKHKRHSLRFLTVAMAMFVFLVSSGYTHHREICHQNNNMCVCYTTQDMLSCCENKDQPSCCSGDSDKPCSPNLSTFIQFDFHAFFDTKHNRLLSSFILYKKRDPVILRVVSKEPINNNYQYYYNGTSSASRTQTQVFLL